MWFQLSGEWGMGDSDQVGLLGALQGISTPLQPEKQLSALYVRLYVQMSLKECSENIDFLIKRGTERDSDLPKALTGSEGNPELDPLTPGQRPPPPPSQTPSANASINTIPQCPQTCLASFWQCPFGNLGKGGPPLVAVPS